MPLQIVKAPPFIYREDVEATNEISKTSTSFTSGGDALQMSFVIPRRYIYTLGVEYQWRHEEKDVLHRTRVRVDAAEELDLRVREYMGGDSGQGDERYRVFATINRIFDAGTYDIDLQHSTGESGKITYMDYRRLFIRECKRV